jgi:hypothetical protein
MCSTIFWSLRKSPAFTTLSKRASVISGVEALLVPPLAVGVMPLCPTGPLLATIVLRVGSLEASTAAITPLPPPPIMNISHALFFPSEFIL